ncbi:hypothetical protein TREMEDRAFT_64889 [Tremella mesenterica DSM 1558]|uniref:uncharacterized protein n=1 Tax=Tremella mesenterica (strain ATCC 24925 / CBS 8224 / DSM 1558 / NBRC 9311 / NRRL Y-6157 / RJB 2259-6 / UBC 559-6) TaxID=578456 RepID=UPI0003F492F2|nr:uncharacterized protein TREMEDRAFT_64889 [Tremella mesenterica DSM 1558]EIW67022.1 hypothetical protein TREMEDRAFT_64889 [Tremella mesenterica DSM 1558]
MYPEQVGIPEERLLTRRGENFRGGDEEIYENGQRLFLVKLVGDLSWVGVVAVKKEKRNWILWKLTRIISFHIREMTIRRNDRDRQRRMDDVADFKTSLHNEDTLCEVCVAYDIAT